MRVGNSLEFSIDNTYDLTSITERPRTGYFGTSIVTPTVNATTALEINGVNINTPGALTGVAYLGQNNQFSGNISIGATPDSFAYNLEIHAAQADMNLTSSTTTSPALIFMSTNGGTGGTYFGVEGSTPALGGQANGCIIDAANAFDVVVSGQDRIRITVGATLSIPGYAVAGGVSAVTISPGAHTAVTANINAGIYLAPHSFTISSNIATMYSNYFGVPTVLGSAATKTVTNYFNTYIEAPVASTNAAFTNSWALGLGGNFIIPVMPTATANYGLISIGSGPFDGSTSGFFAGNSNGTHLAFNTVSGFAGRIIDARQAGVRQFAVGLGSVTSATSAVLNGVDIAPFTYTITGNTAITTAAGFNAVSIGIPTYSAASAVAITIGSTFTVLGAPVVAGSATLTTPLSIWVQGGTSRFDGNITLSTDNTLQRIGAHSLQFGAANNSAPVSYTLTGGESARGGTDTNTAGGSLTIASGLGTGTGAVSSIVFQTPTVGTTGTTAQTLATRLTISSAGALFPSGTASSPAIQIGNSSTGFYAVSANDISLVNNSSSTKLLHLISTGTQTGIWCDNDTSEGAYIYFGHSQDTLISRFAARSIFFGQHNGTPGAYSLTIGDSSRGGTDSNVAGANGTVQSGLGTGTGALTSLALRSSLAAASGTTAQTYVTGLTILAGTAVLTNYIVANLPAAATAGVGATAFVTDANTTVILGLGQAVVGSGSNKVPVYSDGTNWIIG